MMKMIITDLDDTLLRRDKRISDYTISVLKACQEKGIKVAIATARSKQAASRMLAQFTPDAFIGYGGALVMAGDQVLRRFDIDADVSRQIIRVCQAAPEISTVFATSESVALTNDLSVLEGDAFVHYRYDDFSDTHNRSFLKISVIANDQAAVERIAAQFPMCDMLRYTGEDLYRFANRDAVKWNAVKALAMHYQIDTDDCVAFGDDVNDLEMVEKCGTGIAVENAIENVKAVAKHICAANENDGVAKWLERHLL